MQIVAEGNTHIGQLEAALTHGYSGEKSHIGEVSIPVVVVEVIRLTVVGDKEIEMTVIVKVRPDGSQSEQPLRVIDPCLFGHIGKRPVMIVAVKIVRGPFQAARAALYVDSVILAGFPRTEQGKIVQAEVHVMRDKQVLPAIVVVVAKGRAGGPACVAAQAGALGHIGKCPIAIVPVEDDAAETG